MRNIKVKMNKIFLNILLFTTIQGFSQKNTYYDVNLINVESNMKLFEINEKTNENGAKNIYYTDSIISITYSFQPTHIDFIMRNNLDDKIKIIWDEAIYVGTDELSNGIFHNGVKFIDRENSQTPTSILGGGKISDIIIPKNGVSYSDGFNRWVYNYLFFNANSSKIKLLLPIEINDITTDYIFSFDIEKLNLKTKTIFINDRVYYKSIIWKD